jgi:hypothetical protein
MMAKKLGLTDWSIMSQDFFKTLEDNMAKSEIDYTLFSEKYPMKEKWV